MLGCAAGEESARSTDAAQETADTSGIDTLALQDMALDTLIRLASDTYLRSQYDSTKRIIETALPRAEALGDTASQAVILTLAGQLAYQRSELDTARVLGERALDLKLRIGLEDELWRSYNALGLLAWWEYRLTEAAQLFARAAETLGDNADPAVPVVNAINRGLVHSDLGNVAEARSWFGKAVTLTESMSAGARRHRLQGIALNNAGMLEIWIGNPAAALSLLDQARRHYDTASFPTGITNALGQLGTAYTALGDLGRAIAVLDSAVALAREYGLPSEESSNLEALARAHGVAGDHQRALDLYEEADEINRAMGDTGASGSNQRRRAETYQLMNQPDLATELATGALTAHRSVDARWEVLADLALLADLRHDQGHEAASRRHLEGARDVAAEIDAPAARVQVALVAARVAERSGNPTLTIGILQDLAADLDAGGFEAVWEAEAMRSRALLEINRLEAAAEAGRRAVSAVERVRATLRSGTLRTAFTTGRLEAYGALTRTLLALGDTVGAFATADAARGRALLEQLPNARGDTNGLGHVARAFREGEELLREISELDRKLRDDAIADAADRATITATLAAKRSTYEALRIRAIEQDTVAAALLGGRTVKPQQIMQALEADEVLIEYLVTPERLQGFVVSRQSVASFEQSIEETRLARRVRVARSQLTKREPHDATRSHVLTGLYELLLAPALKTGLLDSRSRLIVVPHGVLSYLPFAALMDSTTDRYLIENYTVLTMPSASALYAIRHRRRGMRDESGTGVRFAFAPLPSELPATRSEVRAFRRLVPDAASVIGRRASEVNVRGALGRPGIVHLATHGVLNPRNPMFSRIELAIGNSEDHTDDGRLEVHELINTHIQADLVFLSGCETGLGAAGSTAFAPGEDYLTLAQAFLFAGARDVIATLWRVEDEGAAAFAEAFYERYGGATHADALGAAQREMLTRPQYRAPYYWATYQLAGSGLTTTAQN